MRALGFAILETVFACAYSCLGWKVECKAERNQEWSGRCRTESVWRGDWRLELTVAWSVGTASGRVESGEWSGESGEESGVESGRGGGVENGVQSEDRRGIESGVWRRLGSGEWMEWRLERREWRVVVVCAVYPVVSDAFNLLQLRVACQHSSSWTPIRLGVGIARILSSGRLLAFKMGANCRVLRGRELLEGLASVYSSFLLIVRLACSFGRPNSCPTYLTNPEVLQLETHATYRHGGNYSTLEGRQPFSSYRSGAGGRHILLYIVKGIFWHRLKRASLSGWFYGFLSLKCIHYPRPIPNCPRKIAERSERALQGSM